MTIPFGSIKTQAHDFAWLAIRKQTGKYRVWERLWDNWDVFPFLSALHDQLEDDEWTR